GGTEIELVEDLAVLRRLDVHVNDSEEVVVLGVGIDTEDVEELLRPVEALDERRQARLRLCRTEAYPPAQQAEQATPDCTVQHPSRHGVSPETAAASRRREIIRSHHGQLIRCRAAQQWVACRTHFQVDLPGEAMLGSREVAYVRRANYERSKHQSWPDRRPAMDGCGVA